MKKILKSVTVLAMVILFNSCGHDDVDGLPDVDFTDISYIINESSHQICMSDIDSSVYPESLTLVSADSAVDGSNVWSSARSYLGVVNMFYTPSYMTVTIDGSYHYKIYQTAAVNTCKCSSGSCKCGEDTAGESDYCCMCGADVINPCERKNWTLVSINGVENTDNVMHTNKDGETVVVWTFTITEEMVEQTLRLLAEE